MSTVTLKQFARDLVTSGELDPPYILINKLREANGQDWADRFALYYFMFYDLEGAVKAAQSPRFWNYVESVYPTAKRVAARRHFRGEKGWHAVLALQKFGNPSQVWSAMYRPSYRGLVMNIERNFQGCQVGPYFAWKAMDILDRCLGMPVNLSLAEAVDYLPEVPLKAVKTLWPDSTPGLVLLGIVNQINDLPAPGADTRKCGLPEAETILCAAYGYNKGTYVFGSDLRHRHAELFQHQDVARFLPPMMDWRQYVGHTLDAA